MSRKGWRKFAKSKFWSWFTLGGNKVADALYSMFTPDYRKWVEQQEFEQRVKDKGYTLEEWFAAFPDQKEYYDSLGQTLGDAIKETVNDASNSDSQIVSALTGVVDNITGQRDIKENVKNRQFQAEQAEIARQWEAEQASIAREWNSIGAQMERAAAAGVNPISIAMQNGGINSSTPAVAPSAPSVPQGSAGLLHNGALDIANTVFSGIGTLAENRLKQSQSDDIVIMRQYNIAEKIAHTDQLKQLTVQAELTAESQVIQNRWLDSLNQATYDNMLRDLGVKDEEIRERRSVSELNAQTVAQIKQDMQLNLQRFNATLPLELQLTEAEINLKTMTVQQVYEEISMRHLQQIEQERRNVQAGAEAESAQLAAGVARATYEDAINSFHNDMIRGAAEAGIAYNDYIYYSARPGSIANIPGYLQHGVTNFIDDIKTRRENRRNKSIKNPPVSISGGSVKGLD